MKRKAKATRKTSGYAESICPAGCGETFRYKPTTDALKGIAIEHFKKVHPDRMALCFDYYSQTWNAQYDACLKALHETSKQRDQAIKERDAVAAQQRTLAAKLNAIVLVLRNDA